MVNARRTLLLAMTVGLAIRLAIVPFLYTEWLDPFVVEHWAFGRVARSIVRGQGFGNPFADTGVSALLPPLYAYLLAGLFRIFGINTPASVIAAAAFNSIVSVVTCIPVFYTALRCFGGRVARWAAWAWALSPYGIYFSADWLWSTCLFTLLLTCLFLYGLWLEQSDSPAAWTGFGLLAGVTALTEPVSLAVAPLWGALSWHRLRNRGPRDHGKRRALAGPSAALAFVIVLSPWVARNDRIFHQFIPVRDGFGLELYLGNSGYSGHWANRAVHPNHSDAELAEYKHVGETAYMDHKRDQALSFIQANPRWFVWMTLRRILFMWTGFWSFDAVYLQQEPLDPPNIFVATSLTLLAFMGLLQAFRDKNHHALRFVLTFLCFPLAYYISHPEAYYLRPLDPLIAILSIYTVSRYFKDRSATDA